LDIIVTAVLQYYLLKNGPKVRLYPENMCAREMLKTFILSQRARKADNLCSEIATCISSGAEIKGNNMEDKRKKMKTELCIWPIG